MPEAKSEGWEKWINWFWLRFSLTKWEIGTKQKYILEIQLSYLNIGSDVVLRFHHAQFTFYQPVQEEEEKAICFERSATDHIQRLTHKGFSKMHDTSARIKRNFLIKTIMPVCLRSVFSIRFQAHLSACTGHSSVLLFACVLFSVLPPCVWLCLCTVRTDFLCFFIK